ncbi:MAG: hypothetical protein IJX53_00620 [Clostridia bacterium]|nr:hypothetical protein [Clostridia bacterium]
MAEKEYIERAALLAEYDRVHVGPPGGARKLIEEAPAADVVEVVHGEWEEKYKIIPLYGDKHLRGTFPVCSKCGFIHAAEASVPLNYCPNCGAKMDRKENRE